jgi:hypothetical protein
VEIEDERFASPKGYLNSLPCIHLKNGNDLLTCHLAREIVASVVSLESIAAAGVLNLAAATMTTAMARPSRFFFRLNSSLFSLLAEYGTPMESAGCGTMIG